MFLISSGGDCWYADRAVIGRGTAKRRFTVSGNHLQVCHTNGGHFFGEWRSTIQEESKLSGVAPIGSEIGGFMLTVSGLKKNNDMSDTEKNSFIQFLAAESHRKDQQNSRLQKTIDDQGERLSVMQLTLDKIESAQHATREENIKLNAQLSGQGASLKSMQSELKKSLRETAKYRSLYEVLRDEKFVGTSQKSGKSRPDAGRDEPL